MLRIDASSTSMNWTRPSSRRIATPRRVPSDVVRAGGSADGRLAWGDADMGGARFLNAWRFSPPDAVTAARVTVTVDHPPGVTLCARTALASLARARRQPLPQTPHGAICG